MATLVITHQFVPGQLALASEVNRNFQDIQQWADGSLGTENLGTLTARPSGGPILNFSQTANYPVININNNGADTSLQIVQGVALDTNKAVISLTDSNNHLAADTAHVRMTLNGSTNIPALDIKHGGSQTLSLTRTQLNLFANAIQATSAGVISATTANLTTANATTVAATNVNTTNVTATGLLNLTAPSSDAIVAKVKGRSSDNNAIVQFKSNDDATVYASATSSPSGLTFNLPDTADSYTFQVNGVTKAVINNNGIDSQYTSTPSGIFSSNAYNFTWDASVSYGYLPIGRHTLKSTTLTIARPNPVLVIIGGGLANVNNANIGTHPSEGSIFHTSGVNITYKFVIEKGGTRYYDGFWSPTQATSWGIPAYTSRNFSIRTFFSTIYLPEAGQYNLWIETSQFDQDYNLTISNLQFRLVQL